MNEKMKTRNIRGTMKILFFAFLIILITGCEEGCDGPKPNQPPTVSITSGPSGTITTNQATFSWSGSDYDGSISGYYYDLDDPTPDNWIESTSKHYSNLTNGNHTFYIKAKDNDGDFSGIASRSFTVSVDTTPPNTTITSGPSGTINYDDVTFAWTGTDNVTSTSNLVYSYKLEGYDSNWSSWISSTSKNYYNLTEDSYTFFVKARDEAGNIDPTPDSRSFTVDTEVIPGKVTGYVKDDDTHNQIYNALVKLYASDGTYTGKSDYTNSSGYFEITNVDPANYYLMITKSGYYDERDPSSGTFTVSDNETEDRGTIYITEEDNDGNIVGYVYESGDGAIENALVKLYTSDGSYTGKSDYTSSSGYFEITSVDPDNYYLMVTKSEYNDKRDPSSGTFTVSDNETEDRGTIYMTEEDNDGNIVGYVYESGDGAIEHALVRLYTSGGSYTGISDYTPSSGYFEIPSVDPANYYLMVTKSGYNDKRDPSSGTFTVSDNETEDRGTIYMTEEDNDGSIVGYVYESGGGAIYNAFIRLYTSDGSYTGKSDYTSSSGYFEITSVDPANYYLIITKSGYYNKRDPITGSFTVSDNETEDRGTIYMEEEINPGNVVGYVYESGDGAIENALVKLYTSSGSYTGRHYYTSPNGYFQITSVDPANYYLIITKSGYYDKRDPSSGTFTVSDGETENRGTIYMTGATEEVYIWIYYNFINHITMFESNHPYYSGHRLIYNGGYSYAWENSCSLDGEFLWLNPDALISYIYLFDPGNDGIYISDNTSSITVEWKAGEKYGEIGPLGFVTSENPSCYPDGNNSIWSGNPGCNSYEKTFSECVPTGSEVKLKIGLEGLWLSGAIAFKEIKLTFHGWEVPARSFTFSRHLVEDKVINQSESK